MYMYGIVGFVVKVQTLMRSRKCIHLFFVDVPVYVCLHMQRDLYDIV
jgi:hypothetical protein